MERRIRQSILHVNCDVLASSCDWTRERFTMDAGLSHAVHEVFIQLYDEGLIYRGKRLVNWDPKLVTAISDFEVISEEEEGNLWYIRYPLVNSKEYILLQPHDLKLC